ncbi:protein unc-93 homolog A [Metopolophium dirhodum]|uniref:protein unc-93 homolog A n=1 Tax=Metopolophium dirhodum TaxID=44670 RepID=UPI0029900745|nr:protein unc-93 homolog A [Metopolophium dirhodum]
MGSLPNLHELCKQQQQQQQPVCVPAAPRLSPCPDRGGGSGTSRAQHRRLQQTNSLCTNNFYGVIDRQTDMQIDEKPFSPTSLRSTLSTTHRQVSVANASSASGKRRDSLSSSAGASSVRRLIEVVRTTPSNMGPVYSRRLLCRNYVTLCLGHGAAAAALVPFMALQGSISAWWWPDNLKQNGGFTTVTTDIGSILLSAMFGMAAMSALFGPTAVHRLGTRTCLVAGYLVSVAFVTVHLYPKVAVLVPGYFLMGAWLGCWTASRTAVLMALASKMAYVLSDREECELEGNGRREAVARNLARGLQVAHDIGLIAGNAFVAYMISGTRTDDILGTMFARDGGPGTDRTCGSVACPLENTVEIKLGPTANFSSNQTVALVDVRNHMVLPCKTTQLLASVFAGCCFVGVAVTATFMTRIRLFVYASASEKRKSDSARSFAAVRDAFRNTKLQLIAPLSLFIGLEQGFIYSDFSKFYVVCSVGVSNVPTVLLSLGLLQLVAGFTVSLILQHIRRYHIIVIGLAFHSCLLMVLMKWKPSGDDAALLYVIAAAWGVCNAIWNTLCFNFVISLYPDYWHGPMAHGYFFRYAGMALAFGLHSVVCNTTKLYCLSAALVVAVVLYGWLEWRLQLTGKRRRAANRSS